MYSPEQSATQQVNAVLYEYEIAIRDGALILSRAIREANPDLTPAFNHLDSAYLYRGGYSSAEQE